MKQVHYFKQSSRRNEYTITILAGRCCLHLTWKADRPGDVWMFDEISIANTNIGILREAELLTKLATLPIDASPGECEQYFKDWGIAETHPS